MRLITNGNLQLLLNDDEEYYSRTIHTNITIYISKIDHSTIGCIIYDYKSLINKQTKNLPGFYSEKQVHLYHILTLLLWTLPLETYLDKYLKYLRDVSREIKAIVPI